MVKTSGADLGYTLATRSGWQLRAQEQQFRVLCLGLSLCLGFLRVFSNGAAPRLGPTLARQPALLHTSTEL
eukprot:1907495-Amphidinium_carterae.1